LIEQLYHPLDISWRFCFPVLCPDNFLHHMPTIYREPLRPLKALPLAACPHRTHGKALPFRHRYFELMRQTKILSRPRGSLVPGVFAGCDDSLLEVGPSRRYLYESFSTCLDPYPGCSCGAFTRCFPQNFGLPGKLNRSALSVIHTIATSVWGKFRSCSHSLMFKPADLLATQIAPTAANIFLAEQP
jgi:hypothetical protein